MITAVQGASILPVIASVQPIDEERGSVYFKQIRHATTKGTGTAGQVVVDPRTGVTTSQGYASNILEAVTIATSASGTVSYTATLVGPIKRESFVISLATTNVQGKDVGNGAIWGAGVSGTIDYITGVVTLTFAADPGAGKAIVATYQQNYELSTDLPQIDSFYDSKSVMARVYALKGTIGMLQSYGMTKRFGMVAEDELAKDLVQEINREIGGDMIRKLANVALGLTTWSRTPPAGVSYFEHKQTFKDALQQAEATIVGNAGRGTISVLVVGKDTAAIIATLPGFQKLSDGTTLGSHVYGTLDGVTVVRVIEPNILGGYEGLALWKGQSPWEAAAVYAPFMPLSVTDALPQAPNPLISMKAAAVWCGVETLVPQYVTKFNVIA